MCRDHKSMKKKILKERDPTKSEDLDQAFFALLFSTSSSFTIKRK